MLVPPIKLLRMDLIDEPSHAMRISIDDDYLKELAASIAAIGLTNPIAVVQANARYEIKAGHCRYLACRMLGRAEIEARDYTDCGINPEHLKVHENLHRRDVSDIEMVEFLAECREMHDMNLEQLMALTGKSEAWISQRLSIHRGHRVVYDALMRGELKLAQCIVLNKFPSEYATYYTEQAIQSTPPVRVLEDWLRQFKQMNLPANMPADSAPLVAADALPGVAAQDSCVICNERHSPWTMQMVWIHQGCLKTILDAIAQANRG